MIILGISAYYHDSAAALVKDGVVIAAAEEERFNRIKHYNGFPVLACKFCLDYAGIKLEDVDKVVFYEKPFVKFERIIRTHINYAPRGLRTFLSAMPIWLKEKLNMRNTIQKELKQAFGIKFRDIEFCSHHLSHAALACSISPFENCAVLVIDAVGEEATTSIFKVSNGKYHLLQSIPFPHSLGLIYSAVTYYLGFKVNSDEYKVMGLAPYGDKRSPEYEKIKRIITTELVEVRENGSIKLNDRHFTYMYGDKMVSNSDWQELFGFARRNKGDAILSRHKNMALAIQNVTEQIILNMAAHARQISDEENLCVVGGCALNCAAIGKLKLASTPNSIFVPYAPGDDGAALGCALYASGGLKCSANFSPYFGPEYSDAEVEAAIADNSLASEQVKDFHRLCEFIAQEITNGKIVGWFQGRMEFGPRALGNRSILADPRNPKMKDMVNARIKFREAFRPFAPAVIERYAADVFDHMERSPYMSTTFHLVEGVSDYPAITHVDKTARIQTVSPQDNARFYELLEAFYALTGSPLLLNTSFNVMGEPIVCSPQDAVNTFRNSGIDILVMNNHIVRKP